MTGILPFISFKTPQQSSVSLFPLTSLPAELISHISTYLSPLYKTSLASASHLLHDLISPSIPFKLNVDNTGQLESLEKIAGRVSCLDLRTGDLDSQFLGYLARKLPELRQVRLQQTVNMQKELLDTIAVELGSKITHLTLNWLYDKPTSVHTSLISKISHLTTLVLTITWTRSVTTREQFLAGLHTALPKLQHLTLHCQSIPFRPADVDDLMTQFFSVSHFPSLATFSLTAAATRRTKSWWGSREYFTLKSFLLQHQTCLNSLTLPFWASPEREMNYAFGTTPRGDGMLKLTQLSSLEGPLETIRQICHLAPNVRTISLKSIVEARGALPHKGGSVAFWPSAPNLRALHFCANFEDEVDLHFLPELYPKLRELYVDISGITENVYQKAGASSKLSVALPSPVVPLSPTMNSFPSTPAPFEFPLTPISLVAQSVLDLSWLLPGRNSSEGIQAQIDEEFVSAFNCLSWISIRLPRMATRLDGAVQRVRVVRGASGNIVEFEIYEVEDSTYSWSQ